MYNIPNDQEEAESVGEQSQKKMKNWKKIHMNIGTDFHVSARKFNEHYFQ